MICHFTDTIVKEWPMGSTHELISNIVGIRQLNNRSTQITGKQKITSGFLFHLTTSLVRKPYRDLNWLS